MCGHVCSGCGVVTHWGPVSLCHCGTLSSLVQVMICCLLGAKPLPEPMTACQLHPQELTSMEVEYNTFIARLCFWQICLQKFGHFHQASMGPGRHGVISKLLRPNRNGRENFSLYSNSVPADGSAHLGARTSTAGIILCMHPAIGRWLYIVTLSFICWTRTQNDPCYNNNDQVCVSYTHIWDCGYGFMYEILKSISIFNYFPTQVVQVDKILPCWRQGPVYLAYSVPCLLVWHQHSAVGVWNLLSWNIPFSPPKGLRFWYLISSLWFNMFNSWSAEWSCENSGHLEYQWLIYKIFLYIPDHKKIFQVNIFAFVNSIVPADGLAQFGARSSAGAVMTSVVSQYIYTRPALQG